MFIYLRWVVVVTFSTRHGVFWCPPFSRLGVLKLAGVSGGGDAKGHLGNLNTRNGFPSAPICVRRKGG
jgi:hypothetical protein